MSRAQNLMLDRCLDAKALDKIIYQMTSSAATRDMSKVSSQGSLDNLEVPAAINRIHHPKPSCHFHTCRPWVTAFSICGAECLARIMTHACRSQRSLSRDAHPWRTLRRDWSQYNIEGFAKFLTSSKAINTLLFWKVREGCLRPCCRSPSGRGVWTRRARAYPPHLRTARIIHAARRMRALAAPGCLSAPWPAHPQHVAQTPPVANHSCHVRLRRTRRNTALSSAAKSARRTQRKCSSATLYVVHSHAHAHATQSACGGRGARAGTCGRRGVCTFARTQQRSARCH